MSRLAKTIALVDWNWAGHHPTYFNYFVLTLEELGLDVLALCPDPVEAERTANEARQEPARNSTPRGQAVFGKVQVAARRFHGLRPARIGAIDWAVRHFRGIEQQVQDCGGKVGRKADAIFYACIYDRDFEWAHLAQPFLRIPWVGLYLWATSYRMPGRTQPGTNRLPHPDKMFGGRLCKAISILDEGITEQVSASIGRPVVVFPDLTNERMLRDTDNTMLENRLRGFANGRPVIGLFGYLQKSKGVSTFLEAVRNPLLSHICFALGGEMVWPPDSTEALTIQRCLAECPNLWSHLARIPDGEHMNSLLRCCDLLYAAYLDFPHSSNIMTKAALLQKPLIVSDGYLMAERVRRFNMGEVVPQGNVPAIVSAISKIANDPKAWVAKNQPRWSHYLQEHSFDRLKDSFRDLLAKV